jgi:Fur family ferric uptake transcriptional regulator
VRLRFNPVRQGRSSEESAEARTKAALDRFERFLHRKALRLTEARSAIVEAALARHGHYPIDDLIADLKARGIRGSKATVYRTLPLLAEAGILQPAIIAADTKRYETTFGRHHHDHLLCSRCNTVVEFEFEAFEILEREVASKHGYRLDSHYHELVGTCPTCLAAEGVETAASMPEPGTAGSGPAPG